MKTQEVDNQKQELWRSRLKRIGQLAALCVLQTRSALAYRSNYILALLGMLLQIVLLRFVWTAVYIDSEGSSSVAGVDLQSQLTYSTLGVIQFWLFNPGSFSSIPERVRDGLITADLLRPIPFVDQAVAGQLGVTIGLAPWALVSLPVAVTVGGAELPSTLGAGIGYLLSLSLGCAIMVLTTTTVAMAAFWTWDIGGIVLIYRLASQFFSGALVPLWLMPDWLRGLAEGLPFQGSVYAPLSIYLGRVEGSIGTLRVLSLQLAWVAVGWIALKLLWSRAHRRLVIQGG